MASSYTSLGVELMVTGENAGTWGTKTNTNLNIIEQILSNPKEKLSFQKKAMERAHKYTWKNISKIWFSLFKQ